MVSSSKISFKKEMTIFHAGVSKSHFCERMQNLDLIKIGRPI